MALKPKLKRAVAPCTTEKAKYIADTNRKWLQNAKGQGHVHLAFFFDAAAYGGLIVLNSYILHNYIWWQLKLYDWQNYVETWQLPGFESCWGSWLELPMLYHYMITQSSYQHTTCTGGIENLIFAHLAVKPVTHIAWFPGPGTVSLFCCITHILIHVRKIRL